MAKTQYWMIKSEPQVYPYSQLESEKRTTWTGIRNYEARNNLRAMRPGELALYYHSGGDTKARGGKEFVGVARIVGEATEDPTAPGEDWAAVEVEPHVVFVQPVGLATIKADPAFATFALLTHSRLSVAKVSAEHFKRVLKLGKTTLPR